MKIGRFIFASVCLFLVSLVSCKPSVPSDIISKGIMEDILYDYHIALAMANNSQEKGVAIAYREAVLKKYKVTSAEFDSSMVYYLQHTELLHKIYENLSERLSEEAVAFGGTTGAQMHFGNLSSTGDTADVWREATCMVFSPEKPFNNFCFNITPDSSFHSGDRLMLDFDAQFLFQDGIRDGIAVLAVKFSNDSVASQTIHVQNTQHYSVEINNRDSLNIKNVSGYFLLGNGNFSSDNSSLTTLKLMFLQNIKLIKMHVRPVKKEDVKNHSDSIDKQGEENGNGTLGGRKLPPPPNVPIAPARIEAPIKTR